jgi:hypothetical protein
MHTLNLREHLKEQLSDTIELNSVEFTEFYAMTQSTQLNMNFRAQITEVMEFKSRFKAM